MSFCSGFDCKRECTDKKCGTEKCVYTNCYYCKWFDIVNCPVDSKKTRMGNDDDRMEMD